MLCAHFACDEKRPSHAPAAAAVIGGNRRIGRKKLAARGTMPCVAFKGLVGSESRPRACGNGSALGDAGGGLLLLVLGR